MTHGTQFPAWIELHCARRISASLPAGEDLLRAVVALCRHSGIRQAAFSLRGSLSSVTLGVYDQSQQVYVTAAEKKPYDIVSCSGDVVAQKNGLDAEARVVLADQMGSVTGGRLFSESIVFAATIDLQEITGATLERTCDPATGLTLIQRS